MIYSLKKTTTKNNCSEWVKVELGPLLIPEILLVPKQLGSLYKKYIVTNGNKMYCDPSIQSSTCPSFWKINNKFMNLYCKNAV